MNKNVSFSLINCLSENYMEVLALNNASTPEVNEISLLTLQELARMSSYFRLAVNDLNGSNEIVGALLVLPSKQPYKSLNYQWFNQRYEDFLYVDRIFVKRGYIGLGIGRLLYEDLLSHYHIINSTKHLCCEVNIQPMNKSSILFHHHLGFEEVGQRGSTDDIKVSLMVKNIIIA